MSTAPQPTEADARRVAVGAFVGTALEWYDFFLYGTAAWRSRRCSTGCSPRTPAPRRDVVAHAWSATVVSGLLAPRLSVPDAELTTEGVAGRTG